jgi:hypothetical protein
MYAFLQCHLTPILIGQTALANSDIFRKDSRVFPLTVAGTPFAGVPSPELDHAWHELLEGMQLTGTRTT